MEKISDQMNRIRHDLNRVRKDMSGINPRVSLYQKLAVEEAKLIKQLEQLGAQRPLSTV